jgi:addiction module HigA family antidote
MIHGMIQSFRDQATA